MEIPFLEALQAGGMVGDGAMGSVLYERGVFVNRNFDEITLSQPELVYSIHREYLLAGAHVLETNTYGANAVRLARHGLEDKVTEINRGAVDLLRRASEDAAYVAGSMGPTGFRQGEVRRESRRITQAYKQQATVLAEAGCGLLMIETFADPAELRLAVEAARSVCGLPIVAHIAPQPDGTIADGSDPAVLASEMHDWGADVVGANCAGPEVIFNVAQQMVEAGHPVSAFPNAGEPRSVEDRLIYLATPENFGVFARRMFKAGIKLVGGCCGTNPEHVRRVSSSARMITSHHRASVSASERSSAADGGGRGTAVVPVEKRSNFGEKLGRRFVISVEVNPQLGLSTDKPVDTARMLLEAGADVINIADGPRATVRMSNLALGIKMQQQLDMEVLLHVCCRDRNLLGLQSMLLGAHVLGVRNLVVITGDPPKIGDYPDATAVYDVDSIGLLKIAHGLNCGLDPAGKPVGEQTSFVLATGVEPAAVDFDREMLRLRQKVAAGANLIMTQPIYDPAHMERFLEASKDIDVPVLVGILPLASYRNAEFLHNHVPGMRVPEEIRDRMKAAGKGDAARAEGCKIAVESLMGIRDRVAGAYLMPPLGRYSMAAEIISALGEDRSIAPGVPGRRG